MEINRPQPRTHDTSLIDYHVKDVKSFGETVTAAAAAAFPNRGRSRYKQVHVLLLSWEEDDLGIIDELSGLQTVLEDLYRFQTETWKLPTRKSHNSLVSRMIKFLDDFEADDSLLIVYYGGHGGMNDDRRCLWSCTGDADSPTVQWHAIQVMLEETKSDTLILLDCCAAASSASNSGTGVTEVIAACGFEALAPGVGVHSFTRSLTDELIYLSSGAPFTTTLLHNKVLSRIKYWKPEYQGERRRTPVYICLANEKMQRSILIEPIKLQTESTSEYLAIPKPSPSSQSSVPSVDLQEDVDMPSSESSQSSLSDVWPDPKFKCPKVVITVALEDDQRLRPDEVTDWLQLFPALANFVHVEGVYDSDSTLIILSLPVAIWNLMPKDPAVSFIGFVRSRNMVMAVEDESSKSKATSKKESYKIVGPLQDLDEVHSMRVFVEEIAIILDFVDPAKHFSEIVPSISLRSRMLRDACVTCGENLHHFKNLPRYSFLLSNPRYKEVTKKFRSSLSNSHRDLQLCAIVALILFIYKAITEPSLDVMTDIAITNELVVACIRDQLSPGIGSACFWLHTSHEVLSCLRSNGVTIQEPDTWGLQMSFSPTEDHVWVYRILYVLAKSVNLRAQERKKNSDLDSERTVHGQLQEWERLDNLCNSWYKSIPQIMLPLGKSQDKRPKAELPDTLLLTRAAKIGQLFYYLTKYVIAQSKHYFKIRRSIGVEFPNAELLEILPQHSRQIRGIVAHANDRGVTYLAISSLLFLIDTLTDTDEKWECCLLMNKICDDAGWKNFGYNKLHGAFRSQPNTPALPIYFGFSSSPFPPNDGLPPSPEPSPPKSEERPTQLNQDVGLHHYISTTTFQRARQLKGRRGTSSVGSDQIDRPVW